MKEHSFRSQRMKTGHNFGKKSKQLFLLWKVFHTHKLKAADKLNIWVSMR